MSLFVGIDPGAQGALALYDTVSGTIKIDDMPVYKRKIGKTVKTRIDFGELYDLAKFYSGVGVKGVMIEEVGGRPGQSASAAFTFGWSVCCPYAACVAAGLAVEMVPPATWKKAMKANGDDAWLAVRARELFPGAEANWTGPKGAIKHDRIEAAMLALYASRNM